MKTLSTTLTALCVIAFLSFSCQPSGQKAQDKEIKLQDLSNTEVDSTAWDEKDQQFLENSISNFEMSLFRGATWRAWRKIHRDCMDAAWLRRPYYMGVSNTINLGAIVNNNDGLERRLSDAFTEEEINSFVQYGNFTNCNRTQQLTTNINVLLQADIDVSAVGDEPLEAELATKIQSSKKTDLKIDKWRINNVVEGKLTDLLESEDTPKKRYLNDLKKSSNRVITKVIEIEGFNSLIEFESEVSPALRAKLEEGVVANVGSGKFTAELKLVNAKTLQMRSTGNVYVFVELRKAQSVSMP